MALQGTCSNLYRQCPTRSEDIVDYFNNHNGGFFNQVEPSVDQEVTPILQVLHSRIVYVYCIPTNSRP